MTANPEGSTSEPVVDDRPNHAYRVTVNKGPDNDNMDYSHVGVVHAPTMRQACLTYCDLREIDYSFHVIRIIDNPTQPNTEPLPDHDVEGERGVLVFGGTPPSEGPAGRFRFGANAAYVVHAEPVAVDTYLPSSQHPTG